MGRHPRSLERRADRRRPSSHRRDDPDDVQIDTPVGSIGIRGTIIAGHINAGGESEITVIEGAIVVKNGSGEHTLSVQFETVKLNGFNNAIEDLGVLKAQDIGGRFGSLSDVAPRRVAANMTRSGKGFGMLISLSERGNPGSVWAQEHPRRHCLNGRCGVRVHQEVTKNKKTCPAIEERG